MPPRQYDVVSRDAQIALTEFSAAFDKALALGPVDQWSHRLGYYHLSNSIKTTFPIPISAAGYQKREGDLKLRSLFGRSLSIVPDQWQDGVAELLRKITAPDFIGWGTQPAEMAREAFRFGNVLVADVLVSNPLLDLYRIERAGGSIASTINLFADAHPVNILDDSYGTFDNNLTGSAIDATLVKALRHHFRTMKGPNGRPLGLELSHLIVPPAREQEALDFFDRDTVVEVVQNVAGAENVAAVTQRNRHKGVELVVADELIGDLPSGNTGSDDELFAIGSSGRIPAWVLQDGGAPEQVVFDESDHLYKTTGKVAISYVLDAGAAGALPQGIAKVTLS